MEESSDTMQETSGQEKLNAAIAACAQRFVETGSLDDVLREAVVIICDVIGLDRAGIFLYDDGQHIWHGVYGTDREGNLRDEHTLMMPKSGDHPVYRVERGEGDEFFYDDFTAAFPQDDFMAGVGNCFFIALKARGRILGGISVDNRETGRPIDAETREELRRFARYISLALDNQQLLKILQSTNDSLQSANAELGDFADVVSHDLTSPLQTITLSIELVMKKFEHELCDEAKDRLGKALETTLSMGRLLHGILSYSRNGKKPIEPVLLDSAAVLRDVLAMIDCPPGIKIHAENLPHLLCDRTLLHQTFQNLVGNAVKYMGGDQGNIWIACRKTDTVYEFSIKDSGIGIPRDRQQNIFRMFDRAGRKEDGVSSGVGLAIVKRTVERMGGEIRVESEPFQGSTFIFTVPRSGVMARLT
jgi:signal transduction histidine kinase